MICGVHCESAGAKLLPVRPPVYKRAVFIGISFVLIYLVGFALLLGGDLTDSFRHRITEFRKQTVEQGVSGKTIALHKGLFISDLHSDALLWDRDILTRSSFGHVDVPRLIAGNVALQFFTVVTRVPAGGNMHSTEDTMDIVGFLQWLLGKPAQARGSLMNRASYQAGQLASFSQDSRGKLRLLRSRAQLRSYLRARATNRQQTAGILGLEGAHGVRTPADVQRLFKEGYRMLAPVHFFDNQLGGSAHGLNKGGITATGRMFVKELEKRRMILDVSHSSAPLLDDILSIVRRPVLVSHTGVTGTCPGPRNLTDGQIRRIARGGGIIGIAFFPAAICGEKTEDIVRAIKYTADLVGTRHVGLGSDYDGLQSMPFDSSNVIALTDALLKAGFTRNQVRRIMGDNIREFLLKYLP